MNIQSISIVPETVGCNGHCKYCIAAMTPPTGKNAKIDENRLRNALLYARAGGAQSAIITSKGETLLSDWAFISRILNTCAQENFGQRDLHTNAFTIQENKESFYRYLIDIPGRLTNITITRASMDNERNRELMGGNYDCRDTFNFLRKKCDLVVRLSCVMNRQGVHDKDTMQEYIEKARECGVQAIVFRELWIPKEQNNNPKSREIINWSRENRIDINHAVETLKSMEKNKEAHPIFTLPWGQVVYDIKGINVACSNCTENFWETGKGSIKSVVYLPDNHLYSSWEFKGSIIL